MKRSSQMKNYSGPSTKARKHAKKHPTRNPHWREVLTWLDGKIIHLRTPPIMRKNKWLPAHLRPTALPLSAWRGR